MAIRLGRARRTARVIPFNARAQRIRQNLLRQAPHRAQLAHLWPLWGDESACEPDEPIEMTAHEHNVLRFHPAPDHQPLDTAERE
jgi:hypothetical protein